MPLFDCVRTPALAAGTLACLVALGGCSTPGKTRQAMDGPMYPAGYADGCASAREAEKPFSTEVIQDRNMYRDDPSYATGWRQGYSACGRNDNSPAPSAQGTEFDGTDQPF